MASGFSRKSGPEAQARPTFAQQWWIDVWLPCTRRTGTGRPRPSSAGRKIVAARTLAALDAAASKGCAWAADVRRTDAPVVILGSTRITRAELAAVNRRADFPAPLGFAEARRSVTPQRMARSNVRGRPAPARRERAALRPAGPPRESAEATGICAAPPPRWLQTVVTRSCGRSLSY